MYERFHYLVLMVQDLNILWLDAIHDVSRFCRAVAKVELKDEFVPLDAGFVEGINIIIERCLQCRAPMSQNVLCCRSLASKESFGSSGLIEDGTRILAFHCCCVEHKRSYSFQVHLAEILFLDNILVFHGMRVSSKHGD